MPTQKFYVQKLKHRDEAPIAHRLQQLPGVFFAVLNHEEQCAEVDLEDDLVTCEEICRVIAGFGYTVRIAS
jgi:hypothetical protein